MIVNNSSNFNKTKESLSSDGQQYPPISTKQIFFLAVMDNNSTNIKKTKENLNSDGRQFHQYQQNKRKFKQ